MVLPNKALQFTAASNNALVMLDGDFGAYDRAKFAICGRVKRDSTNGAGNHTIMCQQNIGGGDFPFLLRFSNDRLSFITTTDGSTVNGQLNSTATFTSTTDYITFLVHYDSANATAGDRMRMWTALNGAALTEVTSFAVDTNPTAAVVNSSAAVRIGDNGPSTGTFDGLVYQLGFFSGTLPAASSIESSGMPIDISGLTGLWSLVQGDNNDITEDSILSAAWSNTNSTALSDHTPFKFLSMSVTEEDDTCAANSNVRISSSMNVTEQDDSLSGTMSARISTSMSVVEEEDSFAGNAAVRISTSMSVVEEEDSFAGNAAVRISTSMSVVEEEDGFTGSMSTGGINDVSMSVTEENDSFAGTAKATIVASMNIVEEDDSFAGSAKVRISTSMDIVEEDDTFESNVSGTPFTTNCFNFLLSRRRRNKINLTY